ncbi:MAG: tetratricopeptide repeat protein, partial [Chitinophagaceae bacterium]
YKELNDQENEIRVLREVASVHLNEGKLHQAQQELLAVVERLRSINSSKVHYTYNLLSTVYRTLGDLNKGLMYAMMTVESMNKSQDTLLAANFYGDLARMYLEVGNRERSIEYYSKSLQKWRDERLPNFAMFKAAGYISREMIRNGDPRQALMLIEDLQKDIPPITSIQRACVAQHRAYCYDALGQYDLAEKYFLESLKWYAQTRMDFEVTQEVQQDVGRFYVNRKDFKKAAPYLTKALSYYPQKNALATVKDIHFMLFQVDSAEKNYLSAISHLRMHKMLDDSIFNTTKSRQIEELQIQYETSRKENDILSLNNQAKLQQSRLEQANLTKNVTFVSIGLLAVILVLLYNQYRIKYRNNKQLQLQQGEIKEKNDSLEQLLEEKEWLLKEVNHRVKNNLHTVMSLLESQSAYLDDEALQAINQSRNRVYAMSLIHQKLYQTENVASINMAVYLPELVAHLQDSFDDGKYIRFDLQVLPLEVDVSQAVPLGLILNEAITNSIKYAFPFPGKNNEIDIHMRELPDGRIELVIADNGQGLPANFDSKKSSSLGMKLMRGLTGDINGIFAIGSH